MRVLFIGGTRRGYETLEALDELGAELAGVVSLEQDPHERDRYELQIQAFAEARGLPVFQTRRITREHRALITERFGADLALVVGCRSLIPAEVYQSFPSGCLAVHDSCLPHYRGFAPINWSVINGEREVGVTLFHLSERMDGGDIVGQRTVEILDTETAADVYERVCRATVELVRDTYPRLLEGTAPRRAQSYDEGSFTCSRTPKDGWIDWAQPTETVYNLVRALADPYPGACTAWEGKRLRVWKATPVSPGPRYVGRIPGRVVAVNSDGSVDVLTGDGVLRVHEVEREGESRRPAGDVVRSIRGTMGLRPTDVLERLEALEALVAKLDPVPVGVGGGAQGPVRTNR